MTKAETRPPQHDNPPDGIFVLQGDDRWGMEAAMKEIRQRCAGGEFGGLGFAWLDGRSVSRDELSTQVNSLALGSPARLLALDYALDFFRATEDYAWLEKLAAGLPASTTLALVVEDSKKYTKNGMMWQTVHAKHPLRKVLENTGRPATWLEFPLPSQREMPAWIANQARQRGVQMEGGAAAALAALVGNDLYQAQQEIIKTASYAGEGQPVTRDMVRLLCSRTREEDIFAMVDAAGLRNPAKALGLLSALLREQPTLFIFSMLARQVRLLIMAKEIMLEGGNENSIAKETGAHPFVAKKLMAQARLFEMTELEEMYRQLDRMDEQSKTGHATLEVLLETQVADLSRKKT